MSNENNLNSSIKLEITTPEASFKFDEVYMVVMPGTEGEFGVLEGHVPLIATLEEGVVVIYDNKMNIKDKISISSGFVEVTSSSVMILVEQASLMN